MKKGKQTFELEQPPKIIGAYSTAGPFEAKGNFKEYFDTVLKDDEWGEKTHEKTELKIHKFTIANALDRAKRPIEEVDAMMCGDLLNQIISSSFAARDFDTVFLGVYGACSTFGEALSLASLLISSGNMKTITCSTCSHYSTAERQYRYPLELGTQPTPTSQWTVTGSGCSVLSIEGEGPRITSCTLGKVIDKGIIDVNNMGAAMAPAACETIYAHLNDLGRDPNYYDLIVTGDLGKFGKNVLLHLMEEKGIKLTNYDDCGALIYKTEQKTVQGGSGAGCSSLVFNSYLYKEMQKKNLNKILLVPTGALLSKLSSLQGESIPGIAHAVAIEV